MLGKFRGHTCLVQCVYYSSSFTAVIVSVCFSSSASVARQISLLHADLPLSRVFLILLRPQTSFIMIPYHDTFSFSWQWAHCAHSCLPVAVSGNSSSPTPSSLLFVDVLNDLRFLTVALCLCVCCHALCYAKVVCKNANVMSHYEGVISLCCIMSFSVF